jgi:hypothetical protein
VGSHERTLDDLKARYYSICQKLIPHRPNLSSSSLSSSSSSIATTTTTTTTAAAAHLDDPHKKQFIQSYHFDKQREMERKKHVKSLMNRTPAQLQEEEFIYIETRRLEQNLLKRIKNRDELMKLIGGFHHHMLNEMKFWPIVEPSPTTLQLSRLAISNSMNSNLNSAGHSSGLPPDTANRSNSHLHPLEKRNNARRDETMMDEAAISASAGAGGDEQEEAKARDPQGQMESDKKHCIYRLHSYHAGGSTSGSSATHYRTVGLRSTRITLPKTVAASTRLSTVMSELEIPSLLNYLPKPLVMPSRENVESYERLIQATNELADLRRHADRVDSDLKAHRKKKDTLLAALATPPAPLPYSSTEEPSLLPGPANTASVMNDPPLAPELNSQAESNQQDPTQPGLDLPKSTSVSYMISVTIIFSFFFFFFLLMDQFFLLALLSWFRWFRIKNGLRRNVRRLHHPSLLSHHPPITINTLFLSRDLKRAGKKSARNNLLLFLDLPLNIGVFFFFFQEVGSLLAITSLSLFCFSFLSSPLRAVCIHLFLLAFSGPPCSRVKKLSTYIFAAPSFGPTYLERLWREICSRNCLQSSS